MVAQKRVAIYARVSTVEKGQTPETQLLALREYVAHRGFARRRVRRLCQWDAGGPAPVPGIVGHGPQAPGGYRAGLAVRPLCRSTQALVHALKEFHSLGVDFISYQENIDTTTPQGELIFTVMASIAQFESALMSERVKAGMARAKPRARGYRVHRCPPGSGAALRTSITKGSRCIR